MAAAWPLRQRTRWHVCSRMRCVVESYFVSYATVVVVSLHRVSVFALRQKRKDLFVSNYQKINYVDNFFFELDKFLNKFFRVVKNSQEFKKIYIIISRRVPAAAPAAAIAAAIVLETPRLKYFCLRGNLIW